MALNKKSKPKKRAKLKAESLGTGAASKGAKALANRASKLKEAEKRKPTNKKKPMKKKKNLTVDEAATKRRVKKLMGK